MAITSRNRPRHTYTHQKSPTWKSHHPANRAGPNFHIDIFTIKSIFDGINLSNMSTIGKKIYKCPPLYDSENINVKWPTRRKHGVPKLGLQSKNTKHLLQQIFNVFDGQWEHTNTTASCFTCFHVSHPTYLDLIQKYPRLLSQTHSCQENAIALGLTFSNI